MMGNAPLASAASDAFPGSRGTHITVMTARLYGRVRRDRRRHLQDIPEGALREKVLEALEDENARLKRLLAESLLDQAALKDLLSRKW